MIKHNIIISSKAKRDILDIYEYISETLNSDLSALRLVQKIEESIRDLEQMPERFKRYKDEDLYSENIRICPVKNYLIFYRVNNEKSLVEIIRILYSKRNYEDIL
ncbi:type II toxin-antitoxin system RelE/ParE family toxin [Anaerococcus sp. AGMB00486]|uniref:Type II toxin-antitoxin system RelE/ParE family toxin n=1 Tax=Anaerococcus faecalis TaxID=2742993 RepID=A0ABX2NCW6_9FIRM|nr:MULTISPECIES: type II toxin-antitoxin system RelE/ParE family toxin [Anaerococcus]MDY3007309.1 type II toxin-antitoxin system RelE/ParE family toxin [Anaerococcus porci]NVF12544.1 type II toxin-antitoxin system RelE/ParE family toxin [Anaerococcus faecalis]